MTMVGDQDVRAALDPSRPGSATRTSRRKPSTVRGRRVQPIAVQRLRPADLARRVPYVVVVLILIGAGVSGTLWLSARSTEETYALQSTRDRNTELAELKSSLLSSIERSRSAEELASRAQALGMVGVNSAPILVAGPDGVVTVVGDPKASLGAPISPLQPARVASDSNQGRPNRFDTPAAPPAQDPTPRNLSPVPYLGSAPQSVGGAPATPTPSAPTQSVQASSVRAPVQLEAGTLAPLPGPMH